MRFNIHTHTFRCGHAIGTEREYIENAINNGVEILGFSDHSPYCFPDNYYSGFRMKKNETENYFQTISSLREEYKKHIKIYIGFEAEYYPSHFNDFLNFIKPFNPDYLILGQHFLNNEYDGPQTYRPTDDVKILSLYVSQTIEALETKKFTYIAHPDVINYTGSREVYLSEMKKLCDVARRLDIPLEINLLGILENRIYPDKDFFSMAAQNGNRFVFGADAHTPYNVFNKEVILKAEKFAYETGCIVDEKVKLISVFGE